MKYKLSNQYQVDFTAYAPMHTFRGRTQNGIDAQIEIDFNTLELKRARASAAVRHFTTGDRERDKAMQDYMDPGSFPEASIEMIEVKVFKKLDKQTYSLAVLAVLEFMGVRRQMPVSFSILVNRDGFVISIDFKWSFRAYGLKAPRLLFFKVRDIVDIKGTGEFLLVES